MTLRGRLTIAFLAVVLGPVLLGGAFVGLTLGAAGRQQAEHRLGLAAGTVRSSIGALCRQLQAAAVAVAADPAGRAGTATDLVARGLAGAVLVTDLSGGTTFVTPGAPVRPWTACAKSGPTASGTDTDRTPAADPLVALAARVELRDRLGVATGAVWAAVALDTAFVRRLADASGAAVTLPRGHGEQGAAARSTEPADTRAGVLAAAERISGNAVARTGDGRYVRRIDPGPGQPLPLVLSVPRTPVPGRYGPLGAALLLAGLVAVLAAWRLARSTTRPLVELARAADRVAGGDLAARAPAYAPDEVARLADSINRIARETQSYLRALEISRHQLREQLSVLGDTLASTHDLHRILQVILRTALAATGARAGVVLLLDPETGTLVSQCAEGLNEPGPAPTPAAGEPESPGDRPDLPADGGAEPPVLRIPLGCGLLGTVAATGQARRGVLDQDQPPLHPAEPRRRSYVAVPFPAPAGVDPEASSPVRAGPGPGGTGATVTAGGAGAGSAAVGGGAAVGVLALYDRLGSAEFDDTDLATLRTFAGHAAVAVRNVRAHEEVQRLSLTDPLTGLWNYRYLRESIRREVERAGRFGRMLSVLALDLDRFKEINDTYGHAAGDAVLAEFAQRIKGTMREVDLAFRQGGEEFVVLLPETDARGAARVAERLGAAVRETPMLVRPRFGTLGSVRAVVRVTVSIGVAVYPDHARTPAAVLAAADEALYAAKTAGRDTYRMASARPRLAGEGLPTVAVVAPPDDGSPWVGGPAGGALSGPQPPRQGRGR